MPCTQSVHSDFLYFYPLTFSTAPHTTNHGYHHQRYCQLCCSLMILMPLFFLHITDPLLVLHYFYILILSQLPNRLYKYVSIYLHTCSYVCALCPIKALLSWLEQHAEIAFGSLNSIPFLHECVVCTCVYMCICMYVYRYVSVCMFLIARHVKGMRFFT